MKLLSIAEIAKMLDLPESTVHYYRKRFNEYIPSVGEGRHRRYKPEAVEVIRLIASLVRDGTPADEVKEALAQQFPITIELQQESVNKQQQVIQQHQSTTMLQELMSDAISQAIQQQTQQIRYELELLRREVAVTQSENERLHRQLEERIEERDRVLLETLKEMQEQRQQELQKKRRWWQRGK